MPWPASMTLSNARPSSGLTSTRTGGRPCRRAFLRHEREQIDLLARGQRARGIEPACEQNLVNQKVELSDVAVEFGFVFRISCLLIQLDAELETRQGSAKVVRRIREQHAMGVHEFLN